MEVREMAALLDEAGIQKWMEKAPGWERMGGEIKKKYKFKNFVEALKFVNRIGELAESMDHHPDILIHGYKFVTLTLSTHSAGGLTRMDFDLAQKIEATWTEFQSLTPAA
jgi:4a-hydroxytetrahydrobiopterin dehydratase